MHVKHLLISGGMTALAAVMALTALPAEAFAQNERGNANRAERVQRGGGGDFRANRSMNRSMWNARLRPSARAISAPVRWNSAPPCPSARRTGTNAVTRKSRRV